MQAQSSSAVGSFGCHPTLPLQLESVSLTSPVSVVHLPPGSWLAVPTLAPLALIFFQCLLAFPLRTIFTQQIQQAG